MSPEVVRRVQRRGTTLDLFSIPKKPEDPSGSGFVVIKDAFFNQIDRTISFNFQVPSESEVTVGSGGVITNHEVSVKYENKAITVTRGTNVGRLKRRPLSLTINRSDLMDDTTSLLEIGAVVAGMRFVATERSLRRRANKHLRRSDLIKYQIKYIYF